MPPVLFIITLPFKEPILTLYFTTIGSLKASINEKNVNTPIMTWELILFFLTLRSFYLH